MWSRSSNDREFVSYIHSGELCVRDVEGGLGGPVPQAAQNNAGEHSAFDADDRGDMRMPFCCGEFSGGGRQVFGAVAKAGSDLKVLINRNLDAVGRTEHTALTAFTDGCSGLRRILADAGVTTAPFLDWFHIGMRLQACP